MYALVVAPCACFPAMVVFARLDKLEKSQASCASYPNHKQHNSHGQNNNHNSSLKSIKSEMKGFLRKRLNKALAQRGFVSHISTKCVCFRVVFR